MAEDTSIQAGPPQPEVTPVAPTPGRIHAWEFAGVMIVGYVPPLLGSVGHFTQDAAYLDMARQAYYLCIAATVAVLVRKSAWIALGAYVLLEGLSRYGVQRGGLGFPLATVICHDLATIVVLLGLTARAPGGWSELGLQRPERPELWLIDLALGVTLFFAVRLAWLMLVSVWYAGQFDLRWPMPEGDEPPGGWLPATIAFALVSAKEELLMRGYLITRFETLVRSDSDKGTNQSFAPTVFAILASAFLVGLWHASAGSLGVIHSLQCGLLWGVVFAATRRLTANFLSHWMTNLGPDRLLRLLVN